jgi:hypothetical protein
VIHASVVLTDSSDEALATAVQRFDGWRLERLPSAELPGAIGTIAGTRLVYARTNDPTLMRAVAPGSLWSWSAKTMLRGVAPWSCVWKNGYRAVHRWRRSALAYTRRSSAERLPLRG